MDKFEGFKITGGQIRDINDCVANLKRIHEDMQRDLSNIMSLVNAVGHATGKDFRYELSKSSYENESRKHLDKIGYMIDNCTDAPLAALDTFSNSREEN
jgi:hypothetical protein